MGFKWSDYIKVAEDLRAGSSEAALRTAVSRAYYAAFGEARASAERELGEKFMDRSVHEAVINHYDQSQDFPRRNLAASLKHLKTSRVLADYRLDRSVDRRIVNQAIADANRVLSDLASLHEDDLT